MNSDKQKFVEAARCGLKWLEVQAERKSAGQWKHEILKRVCNAVIDSSGDRVSFIAKDIYESEKEQESGSQLNKEFRRFGKILDSWAESFNEVAMDYGFSAYLSGKLLRPVQHNVLELYVRKIDSSATVSKDKIPQGHIRYTVWERKALPRWQQRLLNRDMGVGTHLLLAAIFLLVPIVALIYAVALGFLTYYQPTIWNVSVFIGVICVEFFVLRGLYEFWYFHDRKIMMLPIQFTPLEQPPTALVMRGEKDKRWPVIHAMATSAECILCDGTVFLRKESHYRYRVIGACNRHPTEHRFTFDYTNMLGKVLAD